MIHNIFKGLGIALVTPFTSGGQVDYEALERLIHYQIDNGADFLCIMATTGETPTLATEERHRIKELVLGIVNGRLPILMGCGGNNTAAVVEELQKTDFSGIDGILSVCPFYNKPTQEGLFRHFEAISRATPLPIVLYNVPGRTGVNLDAATTVRLARECRNIVAIKEASGSIEQVEEIIKNKPAGFDVISGDDALTCRMIERGAVGVISVIGNALPRLFARMVHLGLEGDHAHAAEINTGLADLFSLLFADGNPAGVKAMLADMGMIENVLRLPLVPARPETISRIAKIVKELSPA
ncbi:MAG: 4-hydroxy-tetrahydrodipicolinate synthase [Prevotella sp.]|uniref:4-hydroxy-tetrahydrodipicolinate synthase n=1 Tax=Prevotella sp. TaxID=59823 RepID=UPI002A2795FB|nr:4-hydroxy-tetrahydrodipicolinate synthase [Prevotella sp.]MDD7317877.1 4-hydroxy-tetrahydrodipicolinate synthase [Prevotellaceae bacterium]MDY4019666.1 4-hydroxy-tetrahydrodipicolinate synthase [Prevotella sp.]